MQQFGGAAVTRKREGLEKITGVAQYGLVDPYVRERFDLEHAMDAIALVEGRHAAGKVIIEP